MINNLRKQQKSKTCTVYHNYNISTKNFDGKLLYQLFLASGRLSSTTNRKFKFEKQEKKIQIRSESKRSSKVCFKSQSRQSYRNFNQPLITQTNKNLINLLTSVQSNEQSNAKDRKFTQQNNAKQEAQKQSEKNDRRQLYSAQKFYQSFYKSMQTKRTTNSNSQQNTQTILNKINHKLNFSSKIKKLSYKKKENLKIEDFVMAETIQAEPWVQGKLGGFSAEFISVISNNKRIYSYYGDTRRQIASLTKIMTCITCLFLAKKYQLNIGNQQIKVSRKAALLEGTSAELEHGDVLTMRDLLYGMMLPSGNDAAQALADFFDKYITDKQRRTQSSFQTSAQNTHNLKTRTNSSITPSASFSQSIFLKQMNNLAQHLIMKNTHFDNVHGLSNKNNYSTANDMVQLCHYAMKNSQFRQIVKCQQYECKVYSSRQRMKKNVKWLNTNKLLSLDYCQGIKTGITPTAGPCMAASFQKQGFSVTIVILNAKNKSKRFQQVKNLYEWAFKQIKN